jgi:hypothetical protein
MNEAIISAIAIIVVALISFHGGRSLSKAQKNAVDVETLFKLSKEVQILNDDLLKLKNEVERFEDKNRVLWQYVYTLIENFHSNDLTPPNPPIGLESDPKLLKLIKRKPNA